MVLSWSDLPLIRHSQKNLALQFERGTFGKPLTKAAQEKHIQELYGSRTSAQPLLLESSLLLNVAQNGKASTANQGMPAKGSLLAQPLKAGTAALPGTDRLGLNAIQNPISTLYF